MNAKRYRAGGLLAAGALTGAVLAGTIGADAASSTASPAPSYGSSAAQAPTGHNPNETVLTGTDAARARTAALKAVPGGTVERVETDSGDAVYEAHMTKADGTRV